MRKLIAALCAVNVGAIRRMADHSPQEWVQMGVLLATAQDAGSVPVSGIELVPKSR